MTTYTPLPFYYLTPRPSDNPNHIPISEIATRVYGKPYNALEGCRNDFEHFGNDSHVIYLFDPSEPLDDYEEALYRFDEPEIYLGWNYHTRESVFKTGMTQVEYWKTLTVDPENGEYAPDTPQDLEGFVFNSQFLLDRHLTPSLRDILADLIRRGELPRGNYIFDRSW